MFWDGSQESGCPFSLAISKPRSTGCIKLQLTTWPGWPESFYICQKRKPCNPTLGSLIFNCVTGDGCEPKLNIANRPPPHPPLLCASNVKRVCLTAEWGCLYEGEGKPGNPCPQLVVPSTSPHFMSPPPHASLIYIFLNLNLGGGYWLNLMPIALCWFCHGVPSFLGCAGAQFWSSRNEHKSPNRDAYCSETAVVCFCMEAPGI